ncbi:RpsU-divergently transcribed [Novosphingobium fuchskuhlense]|uniref:RpsU-divergently transcribed n=2 Tax=Novosphingobium fuchskuhlense TaxID=1117702 RepID=A0A124JTW0_9SPHN|nr:RpsU-divergently transcribed [Novosphingobium fuchskuhlense]
MRLVLAPHIAEAAAFDGWTEAALNEAAEIVGIDPAAARFAFQGEGGQSAAMAMITAWAGSIDRAMAEALPAEHLGAMKVRERISALVTFRLDQIAGREEALRAALIEMAKPWNVPVATKLAWRSADAMWRLAGDTATDYNHYTKRAILGSIYAATLAVMAEDKSEDREETRAFLARRIDGIMRFEKAKARFTRPSDETFSVTRLLGRLRYPAR